MLHFYENEGKGTNFNSRIKLAFSQTALAAARTYFARKWTFGAVRCGVGGAVADGRLVLSVHLQARE